MAAPRCQRSSGMVPSLSNDISSKIAEISTIFPTTKHICVITKLGDLVGSISLNDQPPKDLLYCISALHQAALQFASTLDTSSCPIIHVAGETQMLSCYEAGPCIIAFYIELEPPEFDAFELAEQDAKVSPVIEDLRLMLQSLVVSSSSAPDPK